MPSKASPAEQLQRGLDFGLGIDVRDGLPIVLPAGSKTLDSYCSSLKADFLNPVDYSARVFIASFILSFQAQPTQDPEKLQVNFKNLQTGQDLILVLDRPSPSATPELLIRKLDEALFRDTKQNLLAYLSSFITQKELRDTGIIKDLPDSLGRHLNVEPRRQESQASSTVNDADLSARLNRLFQTVSLRQAQFSPLQRLQADVEGVLVEAIAGGIVYDRGQFRAYERIFPHGVMQQAIQLNKERYR